MPYNIHFRYDDNFIKELFNYNNKLLDILIYEYKNKIIRKVKYNILIFIKLIIQNALCAKNVLTNVQSITLPLILKQIKLNLIIIA